MKKILVFIITAIILCSVCYADNENYIDTNELENSVPDYVIDILGESELSADTDIDGMWQRIIHSFNQELQKVYKPALRRGLYLIVIAMICSVLEIFAVKKTPVYVKLCCCSVICILCAGDMGSYISLGKETMSTISEFSNALLPTLCTAGIVCGTPIASAAKYAASALFMDILVYAADNFILPMILAYTALVIASSAFENKALSGVCNLIKWLCTFLITALTLAFVIYISVSSAVSTGGDAVASKVAKTTISTVLPVVGGIISDAASAVVAGAELMRSVAGVFGMLAVLAMCVAPFAALGINFLIFKASAALVKAFDTGSISNLINGIGNSIGMILALVGSSGIMIFISIISCIKAVSA